MPAGNWPSWSRRRSDRRQPNATAVKCRVGKAKRAHASTPNDARLPILRILAGRRVRRTRDAPGDLRVGNIRAFTPVFAGYACKRLPAHQHRVTRLCPPYGSTRQPVRHEVVTHVSGPDKRRDGAAEGIRTPDPRITNAVLYRLSYRGKPLRTLAIRTSVRRSKSYLLPYLLPNCFQRAPL